MKSIWQDTTKDRKIYPSLEGEVNTSVAIIGGGMAGLLTAYLLKKEGIDCTIIEAKEIGMGVTRNTTAKITSQHNIIYNDMINNIGIEKASMYLESNEDAINKYKDICEGINCDFKILPSFVYSKNNKSKIKEEVNAVNKLGLKAEFVSDIEIPINIAGAIKFNNQAQFNPLKFISYISKDLKIYENTFANYIEGNSIITDKGKINAEKIIVTTHFPFMNKYGFYFLKMYQKRSYVLALENCPKINGMYIDECEGGLSFREYDGKLLLGGCGHRTGEQEGGYKELRNEAKKLYPESKETHYWATQDCITIDKISYIGKYSNKLDNVYVSTGFNKWGMTSSMVGAEIICDMILGKKNKYEDVFSPQRFNFNKEFFIHVGKTLKNFVYPSTKRCTHLGCTLKYNKQEHTWDCPCHGSRFTDDGKLIDNPAQKGLK